MSIPAGATVAVIGLGYVGLPLAIAFGARFRTIGYDLSREKIAAYRDGRDPTGQVSAEKLRGAALLEFTTDAAPLAQADFVVIAVPTPVDAAHQPDFRPLRGASEAAGRHLKSGATVIYESTVYPGATEEICIPVLERASGRRWKHDFFVGYSPERINPGDGEHTLERIVKVVAGDTLATLERVAALYGAIVPAGVHRTSSIRVAEAAKIIENTQRDLNIAFVNELAILFRRLGIDTREVLDAAATKWNFLPFRPGLVGGHCIGVDPYYLTHKAEMVGYHPDVILAGRRINDGMGKFIADETVKLIARGGGPVRGARVNVLGLTFKEDCPDLRNSKVFDVIGELRDYGCEIFVHDPVADPADAEHEHGIKLVSWRELPRADALALCVAHREFTRRPIADFLEKVAPRGAVVDVKALLEREAVENAGLRLWRL